MKKRDITKLLIPFSITLGIFGIGIWIYYLISLSNANYIWSDANPDTDSKIGEFIGGIVGTIFSLVGVILFYSATVLQRKELELQRKELKNTQEVFNEQASIMRREQFENTLFSFLESHRQIKNQFTPEGKGQYKELTNFYDYIKEILKDLSNLDQIDFIIDDTENGSKHPGDSNISIWRKIIVAQGSKISNTNDPSELAKLLRPILTLYNTDSALWRTTMAYKIAFNSYHNSTGHYFRNLYTIFKFIHEEYEILIQNGLAEQDARDYYKKYFNIVASNLSSQELAMLFYNGLCFPKMKKLIQKHNLLENLSTEDLINSSINPDFYTTFTDKEGITYSSIELKSRAKVLKVYDDVSKLED